MTVHRLHERDAFGPQEIAAMASAYDSVVRALHPTNPSGACTDLIARRIIEFAQRGERNVDRLRDHALQLVREQGCDPAPEVDNAALACAAAT